MTQTRKNDTNNQTKIKKSYLDPHTKKMDISIQSSVEMQVKRSFPPYTCIPLSCYDKVSRTTHKPETTMIKCHELHTNRKPQCLELSVEIFVCCSVLQCVLQCVAVCVAVCCSVCCSVLHAAVCCNVT